MAERSFVSRFKDVINPAKWTDKAFVQHEIAKKSMPETYYIEASGYHNYSRQPGFSIMDPAMHRSLIYGGYAAHNFIELFHCIPEIFAPIHAIASRIANADFQLRKWYNDEVVYNDKDWNRLYETPNPLQHFRELIYEAVVYEYVTGNEFMYINTPSTLARDYRNISTIWNLPADSVEIIHPQNLKLFTATAVEDLITEYKIDQYNRFKPQDVLHIKAVNLKWGDRKLKGVSPLLSADKAIANLIAVYEARNVVYTKRGALGFIVSRKSDDSGLISLTPKEKEGIRNQYYGDYGITGGRSPVGITEAPVDFVKVGMSISELEPFAETEVDAAAIYGALQVPFELAPKPKGSTFSNLGEAKKSFYQNVIIPKANSYMQSLSNKLGLTANRLYLHASFDNVDELQENKKEKADVDKINTEVNRTRFVSGVITLNDWVVSAGFEKQSNPLYDKRLFDMDESELAKVQSILKIGNLQPQQNNTEPQNNNQSGDDQGS